MHPGSGGRLDSMHPQWIVEAEISELACASLCLPTWLETALACPKPPLPMNLWILNDLSEMNTQAMNYDDSTVLKQNRTCHNDSWCKKPKADQMHLWIRY